MGAQWACDLCKRPGRGKKGMIWLQWAKPIPRIVCYNCYMELSAVVAEMEVASAGSQLPIIEIAEEDRKPFGDIRLMKRHKMSKVSETT